MKYAAFSRILVISIGLCIIPLANSASLFLGNYVKISGNSDSNKLILKAVPLRNENGPEQETPVLQPPSEQESTASIHLRSIQSSLLQQREGEEEEEEEERTWEAVQDHEQPSNTVTINFREDRETPEPSRSRIIGFTVAFTSSNENGASSEVNINMQHFIDALNSQNPGVNEFPRTSLLNAFFNPDVIGYMSRLYAERDTPLDRYNPVTNQAPRLLSENSDAQVNDNLQVTLSDRESGDYTLEYHSIEPAPTGTDLINITITPITSQPPLQVATPDSTVKVDPSSESENRCWDKVKRFAKRFNPFSWFHQKGVSGESGSDKPHQEALESANPESLPTALENVVFSGVVTLYLKELLLESFGKSLP